MKVYVGRIPRHFRERDIRDLFERYGRIRDINMLNGFAFVDYDDPRDMDDAIRKLDGHEVDGSRLIVEEAKGRSDRGPAGSDRSAGGIGDGKCFNCGRDDHKARTCPLGNLSCFYQLYLVHF
eukprot:c21131_g1_i2.p1 GENE.c21131_g1_i2~~c21131_g1_i2.p1  ORF type:complete len:122 (-),score=33.10 c21131_g1_i2:149-514(-)